MEIILYNNKSEENFINKNLEYKLTLSGTMREECSVQNPEFNIVLPDEFNIITYTDNLEVVYNNSDIIYTFDIINCNYCYIPEFLRYYFIEDIIFVRTGVYRIVMTVDVLMSFKSSILELDCFIDRNEFLYNADLPDDLLPIEKDYIIGTYREIDDTNSYPYGKPFEFINMNYLQQQTDIYNTIIVLGGGIPRYRKTNDNNTNGYTYSSQFTYIITNIGNVGAIIKRFNEGDGWVPPLSSSKLFSTPIEALVGIYMYPANFLNLKDQTKYPYTSCTETNSISVNYGATSITLPEDLHNKCLHLELLFKNIEILVGVYRIDRKYNNFLDFSPYTNIQFYSPYIGLIDIDPYMIYDTDITVKYVVDITNGSATLCINGNYSLYYPCQIGLELGYTTTNGFDRIRAKKTNNVINLSNLISLGSNLYTGVNGLPTKINNKSKSISKKYIKSSNNLKADTLSDTGNFISSAYARKIATEQFHQSSYQSDASNESLCYQSHYFKILLPNCPITDFTEYSKLVGRPCISNNILKNISGFTVVSGCHIENISNATSDERDKIDSILKSGVIL